MIDPEINPHLALWQSENYVSPGERAWLKWVAQVEKVLGHDLDGNQDSDGYSLDFAHDAFCDNSSVAEYVAEVRANKAALA